MNEFFISIFFLLIVFIGSAIFTTKTKKASLLSYALNLELEYIAVGALIYLVNIHYFNTSLKSTTVTFTGITLCFMGMLIGTQFKLNIIKKVPAAFWKYVLTVYSTTFIFIFCVFYFMSFDKPYLYSIILNTGMPYSLHLYGKLYKFAMSKIFNSMLVLSIYPALSLIHYGIYVYMESAGGFFSLLSLLWVVIFTVGIVSYVSTQPRKTINTISIIFLFILSGISVYYEVSAIFLGFLSGVMASNSPYGDVFSNIYRPFERFFYLFIYIIIGFFIMMQPVYSIKYVVAGVLIFIGVVMSRQILFKSKFMLLNSSKDELHVVVSIGVLPAFLLFDHFFVTLSADSLEVMFVFLITYILTEISNYRILKNETKLS